VKWHLHAQQGVHRCNKLEPLLKPDGRVPQKVCSQGGNSGSYLFYLIEVVAFLIDFLRLYAIIATIARNSSIQHKEEANFNETVGGLKAL
jgi:hypothetical protein